MKPTPEQIAAMEARGWTWQEHPSAPDVTMFRASAPGLGLMLSVWWDVNTGSGWHWTTNAAIVPNKGKPFPIETADEAEAWLRGVLGGFRFPWLAVTRLTRESAEAIVGALSAICPDDSEIRRRDLVAALQLPPETTWAGALARVRALDVAANAFARVRKARDPTAAKGCRGCANSIGRYCDALFAGRPNREPVRAWSNVHLEDDAMTPKPGAPECPGRTER